MIWKYPFIYRKLKTLKTIITPSKQSFPALYNCPHKSFQSPSHFLKTPLRLYFNQNLPSITSVAFMKIQLCHCVIPLASSPLHKKALNL